MHVKCEGASSAKERSIQLEKIISASTSNHIFRSLIWDELSECISSIYKSYLAHFSAEDPKMKIHSKKFLIFSQKTVFLIFSEKELSRPNLLDPIFLYSGGNFPCLKNKKKRSEKISCIFGNEFFQP